MKKTKIAYYIVTVLFSLMILFGSYFDIVASPMAQEMMVHLGYPIYLLYIIGWAKVLGIIGIWQTKFPSLREWAYAGLFIDLAGAFVSHLFVGDPASVYSGALVGMIVLLLSYTLYKKSRTA